MNHVPESHADLLRRPLFAHLATVRPDGSPQSSVMWFEWDGGLLRFSLTRNRQKFGNLAGEPRVALTIADPDDPYRSLDIRGVVDDITDDPDAGFLRSLQERYGYAFEIGDADVRVVLAIRPGRFIRVESGRVVNA